MSQIIDISNTIKPKSDQLNADDLIAGAMTIKITEVRASGSPEQPISIFFEGCSGKPYKPCKGMRRVMVMCWGKYANEYVGKSMTIFRDDSVKWAGQEVGGVRISHMSDITEAHKMAITMSKTTRRILEVLPLYQSKLNDSVFKKPIDQAVIDDLNEKAREAASLGVEAYKAFFVSITKDEKAIIKPFHEELKKTASAVDAEIASEKEELTNEGEVK